MSIKKTLQSILSQKGKISAENLVYNDLIFSFDKKFICTIGKYSKDFFNREDNFYITFYYETLQPFHSDEDVLTIVLSGKGKHYSTRDDSENYDIDLDTEQCSELYNFLISKQYNLDEILKNILSKSAFIEPFKTTNGRPLFVIKVIANSPEKVYNINIENDSTFFTFEKYLWTLSRKNSFEYSLRIFLDTNYNFDSHTRDLNSAEYIVPHYVDFESKNFNSTNAIFFQKLYLVLCNRYNDIETIFRIINQR